jgi:hypothetical protein
VCEEGEGWVLGSCWDELSWYGLDHFAICWNGRRAIFWTDPGLGLVAWIQ